jgi:hypothetical protein
VLALKKGGKKNLSSELKFVLARKMIRLLNAAVRAVGIRISVTARETS